MRPRPLLDGVPRVRLLERQPHTTSFPSGHSASAAAFATGVALESTRYGAVVAPVAAGVAFSRVYVGVHFPGDVLMRRGHRGGCRLPDLPLVAAPRRRTGAGTARRARTRPAAGPGARRVRQRPRRCRGAHVGDVARRPAA